MPDFVLVALLVVCLGPLAGSFLGTFVNGWPVGRGRCLRCGVRLGLYELIPFRWCLNGECRRCGVPIPKHLIRIEVAALGLSLLAVALADSLVGLLALTVYLWCLLGLFYADLLHFRLPDPLTVLLFAAGLALASTAPDYTLEFAVLTAGVGAVAFWVVRKVYGVFRAREGLGMGDVKMMAGLGAGLGPERLPWTILLAAVLALIVASVERWRAGERMDAAAPFPFGSYLAGGAVVVLTI
ncbi:A24 family peptidase [Pseudoruegeria sp. HB172150]|uniref:prepilin peptidase n=1 Tax=Pseudoruegeria sp. HB172150 TaxID=2721164 RepID=UPI00155548C8|nr:A24 family peptidase [Pseudoruegeria sp. HB172150]